MNNQLTITIYGRLGKNPELRQTKKSKPFCTFILAEQIEGQEEARWHNIVMWEQDSEHWSKVLKNEASSSLITFVTKLSCFLISGKNSPIWFAKTSTNLLMKGSFVSKNVNP